MKSLIRTTFFIFLVLCMVDNLVSKSHKSNKTNKTKSPNVCTKLQIIEKEIFVPKTKRIKEPHKVFCLSLPPLCTEYKWKTVTINETVKINHTRTISECCQGFEDRKGSCVPTCHHDCGHGECIAPGICSCDKGWRAPYCVLECEPNRYGRGCRDNCTCQNGASCDKKNGFCYCTEGYTGTYCEDACPYNTYGLNCSHECQCQNFGTCDIQDGACTCEAGYTGEFCEETCEAGTHGDNCENECVCLPESTEFCDHVTGDCHCKAGFEGTYCEELCGNFTYGKECVHHCDCSNHTEFCDPVNGFCVCKPGWIGQTCSQKCPPGMFGDDCSFRCAKCPNASVTCNHETGFCDCAPGSAGEFCEKSCTDGHWGSNCSEQCECETEDTCDSVTGICHCTLGFHGPNCSEACSSGWYGIDCSSECNCSSEESCNSKTGECFIQHATDKNLSERKGGPSIVAIMIVPAILIAIIAICLLLILKAKGITSFRDFWQNKQSHDLSKSTESATSIFSGGISNPVYEYPDEQQNRDYNRMPSIAFDRSFRSTNEAQDANCRTGDISSKESNEETSKTDAKRTSILSNFTALCSTIKTEEKSKRISKDISASTSSTTVDMEEDIVPEVMCDFNIPEDDTYETALTVCRKIENGDKEVSLNK